MISFVLWLLYDILSLKNDVNIPPKRNEHKNFENKIILFVGVLKVQGHWRKEQDLEPNKYFFFIKAAEHWGDLAELNPTQPLPQQVLHTRGEDQQGWKGFFSTFFQNSSIIFGCSCIKAISCLRENFFRLVFFYTLCQYLFPVFFCFCSLDPPSGRSSIDSHSVRYNEIFMVQIPLDPIFLGFDTLTNLKITVPLVRLTQFILCLWCPKSTASLSFLVLKNVLKIHPFWTEGISVSNIGVVSLGPLFYLSFLFNTWKHF